MVNNEHMETQRVESLWTHLYWLTILAQQGSYTRAATRLGVSKAAMSQRIAELERAAGVSLVQRTTRSVRLTEAGQRLVDQTRGQYADIAQSFAGVRDSAGVARGVLRVTAPVAFARQQLVPHLSAFLRANPEVRVQLEVSDRISSLASEGFDLAIRHSAVAPETHVAWTLCKTRSVIVATRTYLRARGTPASPQDLAAHDCLFYPRAQEAPAWTFERATGRKAAASGRVTVPIGGPFSANNSETLRDAALDDLGIALLPDFSAQAALRAGQLIRLLPEWQPTGVFAEQLYIVRPYASHVPRAVTSFVSYLRKTFENGFSD
jgi:DNA-binding transcriptional LysR family regulator